MTLIELMCEIGRRADARMLVDGTGGNFSCRLPDGRILCTPTMCRKGSLTPDDLCEVALDGRQVGGRRRASSEIAMHLALYRADDAIGAVVHTHPLYATTFAVLGERVPTDLSPEGTVFLGEVPLVPYRTTGTAAMGEVLAPLARAHVAALLANHGAVTWGPDLETAYALTETLEAVARIAYQARLIGTPRPIGAEDRALLDAMRRDVWRGWGRGG